MGPGLWIALGTIAVGVIIGLVMAGHYNTLCKGGVANKNHKYDFYQQIHTFKTVVPDLQTMLTALDMNVMRGQGISITQDTEGGRLVFHNSMGTMAASITSNAGEQQDGIYRFSFKLDSWKTRNNSIVNSARMDGNIILTQLEKAFLRLDYNAVVERIYMTNLKSSTSFL